MTNETFSDRLKLTMQAKQFTHKRWSMWFNSKQREEPYQVLTSL